MKLEFWSETLDLNSELSQFDVEDDDLGYLSIAPVIESIAMSSMDGTFTSISENDVSSLNTENSKIKVWNLEIKTKSLRHFVGRGAG